MSRRLKVLPLNSQHLQTLRTWELAVAAVLLVAFIWPLVTIVGSIQSAVAVSFVAPFLFVVVAAVHVVRSIGQIPPVNLYSWFLRQADPASTEGGLQAALLYRDALRSAQSLQPRSGLEQQRPSRRLVWPGVFLAIWGLLTASTMGMTDGWEW